MSNFISAYGPKTKVAITFEGKGRTRQSFKAECDINTIMARFKKTGVMDFTSRYQPRYADVTAADFTKSMHVVAEARSMFFAMPAHIRDRFENKPEAFLEFVQNPNNKEEARALGLLRPEPAPTSDSPTVASVPAGALPSQPATPAAQGAPLAAAT